VEQIRLPRPYINSFHLDRSLLFQFILSEFLMVSQELKFISRVASESINGSTDGLITSLGKLTGPYKERMRLFAWNHSEGFLTRLNHYCWCFEETSAPSEKRGRTLYYHSNKIWQHSMQSMHDANFPDEGRDRISLANRLQKLLKSALHFEKLVITTIDAFHEDENVLFFILRHREQFDEAIGFNFVKSLYNEMHPGGLKDIEKLLVQNYSKRGFHNLLPLITTKLAEL
jgi:hypothetical protein